MRECVVVSLYGLRISSPHEFTFGIKFGSDTLLFMVVKHKDVLGPIFIIIIKRNFHVLSEGKKIKPTRVWFTTKKDKCLMLWTVNSTSCIRENNCENLMLVVGS